MDFPTRLKKLRAEYKLTQEQLGEKINVTKVSVSGYENGNRSPDMETLQKLADVFEVSVDYLLGRTDFPNTGVINNENINRQHNVHIAGQEIKLSSQELEVLREMKKHPNFAVMFHDLATAPEKKVKTLIKMWEVIKADMEEDDDRKDIIED